MQTYYLSLEAQEGTKATTFEELRQTPVNLTNTSKITMTAYIIKIHKFIILTKMILCSEITTTTYIKALEQTIECL